MNRRNLRLTTIPAVLCLALACTSCRKASATAVSAQLDGADALIQQGSTQEAVAALDAIPRKGISPWNALGIYRRYALLGESGRAGIILQKALKKNPRNLELNAVYTRQLMRDNKLEKAASRSKILRGTEYASIYAEAQLRGLMRQRDKDIEKGREAGIFLFDKEYIPVFTEAYRATGNSLWARNAAALMMASGQFPEAAGVATTELASAEEALFWASVMYDSRNYESAAAYLEAYKEFPRGKFISENDLLAAAMLSDAMVLSGREQDADEERRMTIETLASGFDMQSAYAPALYVNSAYWAKKQGLPQQQYDILRALLDKYPGYTPGVIAYGNYALASAQLTEDDALTAELRAKGRRTTAMERFDSIPRVPVEAALARIDGAYQDTHDPRLLAYKIYIQNRSDALANEPESQIVNRVWDLLEKSATGTNQYPSEIAQYAVSTLLHTGKVPEAEDMFTRYVQAKYGTEGKAFVPEQDPAVMELWECEYAAWFACNARRLDAAKRLYENSVNGRSSRAQPEDAANLAMLYSSSGERNRALKLYAETAGVCSDPLMKAELMYRAAQLYADLHELNDAVSAADYALQLNPGHNKARLLQKRLKNL